MSAAIKPLVALRHYEVGRYRHSDVDCAERWPRDWLTSEHTLLDGDTALARLHAGDVERAGLTYSEGAFV